MRLHEIVGDEVSDSLVELGRPLEVGEEEGEAGDLQPLIDVERVGAIEVAERLIGEKALGGEEGPALAKQIMQRVVGEPEARQRAAIGAVLERYPYRTRTHLRRTGRGMLLIE